MYNEINYLQTMVCPYSLLGCITRYSKSVFLCDTYLLLVIIIYCYLLLFIIMKIIAKTHRGVIYIDKSRSLCTHEAHIQT